jgi:hypothetical protein
MRLDVRVDKLERQSVTQRFVHLSDDELRQRIEEARRCLDHWLCSESEDDLRRDFEDAEGARCWTAVAEYHVGRPLAEAGALDFWVTRRRRLLESVGGDAECLVGRQ